MFSFLLLVLLPVQPLGIPALVSAVLPEREASRLPQASPATRLSGKGTVFSLVSCQGLVMGTNLGDVPTDDPDTAPPGDPTVTPLGPEPLIFGSKVDSLRVDVNQNGVADPGDTLGYEAIIANGGSGPAQGLVFRVPAGTHTTLVNGSVTTSQGVVDEGNGPGEIALNILAGDLAAGASFTVNFSATIDQPIPPGVTRVECQGRIFGPNFSQTLTDDPDLPGNQDPTVTALGGSPSLVATKRDSLFLDLNQNGAANYGDTLRYTVRIQNEGNANALDLVFESEVDPNTELVTGSVTTTMGQVLLGNQAGDTRVAVEIGAVVQGGAAVTITFDVVIRVPDPLMVTKVSCQGRLSGKGFSLVTDDPDTAAAEDATETPLGPEDPGPLYATKLSEPRFDGDGDRVLGPGDTLAYQVRIENRGHPLADLAFQDMPDPRTRLVAGSVMASQGAVVSGNGEGDRTVRVDLGEVTQSAEISFEVRLDDPFPAGIERVANQGLFRTPNGFFLLTDDPRTPEPGDPTVDPLGAHGVPTLSQWGLWLFGSSLAIVGLVKARHRTARA